MFFNEYALEAICLQIVKGDNTTTTNNFFYIYKGTMPAYNSYTPAGSVSDLLATFTDLDLAQVASAVRMGKSPTLSTVAASATGTATWGAFYNSAAVNNYILGTVTDPTGDGVIHLDSVSLVSAVDVTFVDFGVDFGGA